MRTLPPATLEAILGDQLLAHPRDRELCAVTGVAAHTDHVRPGHAFVALAGGRAHGIDHAAAALEAGAAFLISDRDHPAALIVRDAAEALTRLGRFARAQRRGSVVGVSGSVGKTTTKRLLGAALDAVTSPGNLNTPHALAGVLVDAWLNVDPARPLVIELGIDRRGEMQQLLALVAPTHAVLTAIAEAHLEGIGSLAQVAHEKGLLLDAAPFAGYAGASAWPHLRDDQRARALRVALGDATPGGELRAERLTARLRSADGPLEISTTLPGPGRPYAEAALMALQVALDLGVDPANAAARIAASTPEPHRLARHQLGALTLLDDAYNANPASMQAALEVLAQLPAPRAAVLGDMRELGARSAAAHDELGRAVVAAGLAQVWFVGPESHAAYEAAASLQARTHVRDTGALLEQLAQLPTHGSLLVKGSRSIGLERIVAALVTAADPGGTS